MNFASDLLLLPPNRGALSNDETPITRLCLFARIVTYFGKRSATTGFGGISGLVLE